VAGTTEPSFLVTTHIVAASFELLLVGAGGEPVDLWRTVVSHGVAELPPALIDEDARTMEITLPSNGQARTVRVSQGKPGKARVEIGGRTGPRQVERLTETVRHVLRLDEDLSEFYALAAADPHLSWAAAGAGRMIRSATVFEEVVKTVCTTNCTWSATKRMVYALVAHLGLPAPGAPPEGPAGRAFPTPEAMAEAPEEWYRDVARTGYRGAYLRALAADVASGELDLEELNAHDLGDDEVERRLLALPGVGPYAAAHVMMLIGRYSRLILDSWTRPTYAELNGGAATSDAEILARFEPYGRYAGLAFWLYLTRDWVP
jgi:3-methyladenine DNA glycosylase/8-oxoguanine DNA glycosylase